jgi:dCMP deaminase
VRVVYGQAYKDDSGLRFLEKAGIDLKLIEDLNED